MGTILNMVRLLVCLLLSVNVSAYWRLPCMGVVARGLIDPIIAPGMLSPHLHTIKGASGISLNSTVDDLLASSCTSCQISQDKSAYWAPQLYFYDNTTNAYEMVQEVSGHLTYYKYVPHFISNGSYINPIAIPNGMKMLSGNPFRRNMTIPRSDPPRPWTGADATQDALRQKAIGFNCLNYAAAPEGTLERHFLPDKNFLETQCVDGIRLEILFPTCWDGVQLTSDDLTSHLAYGDAGANGGNCPKGYDTVIMQLLFETIYPTGNYIGRDGYYVFSNGDPTGFGYHGDALIAWQGTTLEDAVQSCGDPVKGPYATDGVVEHCPVFKTVAPSAQSACAIQATQDAIQANFKAMATALPGNNPVQFGPQQASRPGSAAAVTPVPSLPSNLVPTAQSVAPRTSNTADPYANQYLQNSESIATATASSQSSIITPAPAVTKLAKGEQILSTAIYTSNGAVYEVIDVEIVSTTTIWNHAPRDSDKSRRVRHLHRHGQRRPYVS